MVSDILLPVLILLVFVYAFFKKSDSYNSFLEGAKDGLLLFINIYPTMLAMSFAINLLRTSHVLEFFSNLLGNLLPFIPSSIIPLAIFRPFSGSATLALLVDIYTNIGVDSFDGIMASIIQGSTDTTFYVISLYFAHVQIKHIKNSLSIGLIADLAGISAAILLTIAFFS